MVGEVGVAQPGAESYDARTFDVPHEFDLAQSLDKRVVVQKHHGVPVTLLQENIVKNSWQVEFFRPPNRSFERPARLYH
jgi:hypothetical protein